MPEHNECRSVFEIWKKIQEKREGRFYCYTDTAGIFIRCSYLHPLTHSELHTERQVKPYTVLIQTTNFNTINNIPILEVSFS